MTTEEKAEARTRTAALFCRILGPHWRAELARALDLDSGQVRRWFTPPKGRDDAPPVGVQAMAELLAVTPRRLWPDRWKG
jgi:DNA invertase Pin-like site-specific DNA recombinase